MDEWQGQEQIELEEQIALEIKEQVEGERHSDLLLRSDLDDFYVEFSRNESVITLTFPDWTGKETRTMSLGEAKIFLEALQYTNQLYSGPMRYRTGL